MQAESHVVPRPFMVEESGLGGSELVADNRRGFYETPMQRSVESGISEIFLQNM